VLGVERRVVVTHSESLHANQPGGLDQTLARGRRQLAGLGARFPGGRTRRPRDRVEAEITAISRPRWCRRVISTSLPGESPAEPRLTLHTRPRAQVASKRGWSADGYS